MTTTIPATARQLSYITALLEDKRWRLDITVTKVPGVPASVIDGMRATDARARVLYATKLDALTKDQASAAIDTLKAW